MVAGIPYNSAQVNTPLPEAELMARAARVRLMIFDVDGILTDGGLLYGADGEQLKRFNVLDGHGIKQLQAVSPDLHVHIIVSASRLMDER